MRAGGVERVSLDLVIWLGTRPLWYGLTWSVNVSHSCLSMSVTTRPGSSGVPRWSWLCVVFR